MWRAEAAELGIALVRRGPEMPAVADRGLPKSVDGREGADPVAAVTAQTGRTEAALQGRGRGAKPGSDAAEAEIEARCSGRRVTEIPVR